MLVIAIGHGCNGDDAYSCSRTMDSTVISPDDLDGILEEFDLCYDEVDEILVIEHDKIIASYDSEHDLGTDFENDL